jgi:hypothetical protein
MSVSVSIIGSGGSGSKAPPCIRLLLVFAPAPCPLVTYDLKLAGAGVPYLTLAATASCGALARDDAVCSLSQALRCGRQRAHASPDRGTGHAPVCVCVGSMLVVMGAGGSPVFALHAEQGCAGSELAAGGDSDLIVMLPRMKGGGGGNVHVMRWVAAVKLRDRDLPQQVTVVVLVVVVVAVVMVAMRV